MSKVKILVIDDEQLICWSFRQHLDKEGYTVFTAETGEKGLDIFQQEFPDIVFLDNKMPGLQGLEVLEKIKSLKDNCFVVFMTAFGTIDTAVTAIKQGAYEYLNKPFVIDEVEMIISNIEKQINLDNEIQILRRNERDSLTFDDIVSDSNEMGQIIRQARQIAHSQASTVLLLGESGTGKDLLARAIHNESNRKSKSFVTINCASLPETLLESELFGHERGAFTDAKKQKKGLFEIAGGGTVFLDEIGEVNMPLQVKLLNIIENKLFRRLGGTANIFVDIRIIAATNQNLDLAIQEKRFREDLYYRLKVFQLTLPSLRDRKRDIPNLVHHFIDHFNLKFRKKIKGVDQDALNLMQQYFWPGNVRELRNVVERAIILETEEFIGVESLPIEVQATKDAPKINEVDGWFEIPDEGFSIYQVEKKIIELTLRKSNYNKTRAANLMGITRDTLRYKLKKYKMDV